MRTFALMSAIGLTVLPTVAYPAAGDFNGDGFADLLIGAPNSDGPGLLRNAGNTYVVYGHAGLHPVSLTPA